MSSRPRREISVGYAQFLALVREAHAVAQRAAANHSLRSDPLAAFACCYAVIRVGEGVRRLDRRTVRRVRSSGLLSWGEARNALAHEVGIIDYDWLESIVGEPLERLLSDLERAAR